MHSYSPPLIFFTEDEFKSEVQRGTKSARWLRVIAHPRLPQTRTEPEKGSFLSGTSTLGAAVLQLRQGGRFSEFAWGLAGGSLEDAVEGFVVGEAGEAGDLF